MARVTRGSGVSQSGLNRLDVGARQDQLRGVGAAQVVEPGAFDSRPA